MADQTELLHELITELGARHVLTIDANNMILAYRDQGEYKGKAYDKYRLAPFYWYARAAAWQQASGSLGVPYGRKADLLAGLVRVAADDAATTKLLTLRRDSDASAGAGV